MTKAAASPPGSQENRASLAATQAPRAKTGASIDEWPAGKSQESVTARVDRGTCPTAACATVGMPITSLSRRNGEPWRNPAKCSSATSAVTKACNGRACARRAAPATRCGAWPCARGKPERRALAATSGEPQRLSQVAERDEPRVPTGLEELDRVLGGGLVLGSVTLLGGDPGIGKSTMLLQAGDALSRATPTLYVTGEESLRQVSLRARRLGLAGDTLHLLAETSVDTIIEHARGAGSRVLVIDSIQTMFATEVESSPGSASQVRESAAALVRFAKATGVSVLIIGHVTKEGVIAGPRILEHMVDTVLYFESDAGSRFRLVRAVKNRFGAANEVGVFAMTEQGLQGSEESVGDLPLAARAARQRQRSDGGARRQPADADRSAGAHRRRSRHEPAPRRSRSGSEPARVAARGAAPARRRCDFRARRVRQRRRRRAHFGNGGRSARRARDCLERA